MAQVRRASHRVLGRLQQSVINPVVRLAWNLGIPIPGDALLETPGGVPDCRGGQPCATALMARPSGWWHSGGDPPTGCGTLRPNPRVRVRVSGLRAGWRAGTAHILDGDDPQERRRNLARANPARRLCMCTTKALDTSPLTVRIDLDPS